MLSFRSGNLLTRNLGDLVAKEDFILDSEYLTTLVVVVSKYEDSPPFSSLVN